MDINILFVFTDFREGKERARTVFLYWFNEYFWVDLKHCSLPAFWGTTANLKDTHTHAHTMPDPACYPLRPTGGHSWRWEGYYPFISLSRHWFPVVLQTCHFILRLMLILFGQLMLTQLPTLNLLQFCLERNANPTRRGTQRGTSWIGLAVPPAHHPELRLFAYHIFPWPSTLITPSIKTLRFNHFFRSSFPYESHKTYVRQTCLHFSC